MTPLAHNLWAALPDLGDRTQAQLHDLHKDLTAERARIAAQAAYEVHVTCSRLATELERQVA